MIMLQAMRLRNLRSFSNREDSPYLDLKPLTVLVGKNSSGKSSFIRSLPLLRQSIEARTTGPILWYGSYVDFGAYSEAKKNDCEDDVIYFDFKLNINSHQLLSQPFFFHEKYSNKQLDKSKSKEITISLGVTEFESKTIAKEIKIISSDFEYLIKFHEDLTCTLYVDGIENISKEVLKYNNKNNFLPSIFGLKEYRVQFSSGETATHKIINEDYINEYYSEKLIETFEKHCHKNTSRNNIEIAILNLESFEREDTEKELTRVFSDIPSLKKNISKLKTEQLNEIYDLSQHKSFSNLMKMVNTELENTFSQIRYIAPLRATAERYYRHQDLQVEEIDHTGSNLAMLLKSLSKSEAIQFTKWTLSNFGFKVRVQEMGLHYALKIQTENSKKEYNINDMGFGFSQILPIIASVWLETRKNNFTRHRKNTDKIIFAIEQPELHLHPEYQSRLARMFSSVVHTAKENNVEINIIFETHSKTMIDTIGDCIEEEIISKDDVNIVLFEKEFDEESTRVSFSNFNDSGFLESWPVGFFSGR